MLVQDANVALILSLVAEKGRICRTLCHWKQKVRRIGVWWQTFVAIIWCQKPDATTWRLMLSSRAPCRQFRCR